MEASLARFRAADTHVLGVSIDSVHSHANWGRDLGGVSFPLLADFHPKGAVAESLGCYLADAGITDRATVIVDKEGVVRYAESVTPAGRRDVAELAAQCERVNGGSGDAPAHPKLSDDAQLFVKSRCGFSRRVRVALDNLHLGTTLTAHNVSDSDQALQQLVQLGGKDQAPCLVMEGRPLYEADDITRALADAVAPLD